MGRSMTRLKLAIIAAAIIAAWWCWWTYPEPHVSEQL
jgi:hypothetical protein